MANGNGPENGFECPVCGDVFDTEAERDEHVIQSHPD